MASSNRSSLLTKTHRVLKKNYKPVLPDGDRDVLEQLIFAACLENAKHDQAEKALSVLKDNFFDWNEVRVSSIRELSEALHMLPDAPHAATRVKSILQSVFESQYSFEMEGLKKQNIGQAVKQVQNYEGTDDYVVAYLTQTALGGHAIPVNRGGMKALVVLGVISEAEAAKGKVPGMERAISKSKGPEFGSLLHQLGVDFDNTPFSPSVRKILLEIAPDAKERLPKRKSKKSAEKEAEQAAPTKKKAAAKQSAAKKKKAATKKTPTTKKSKKTTKTGAKKGSTTKKAAKKKTTSRKLARRKPR